MTIQRRHGRLICFIGVDGSGKTTLAGSLIRAMQDQGIPTNYIWCKFESSFFRLLIWLKNRLFVREKDMNENFHRSLSLKRTLMQRTLLRGLFEAYVLLSYWFQILWKARIPLVRGKNLVCDRYVYDTFVDLAIDLHYTEKELIWKMSRFSRLVPRPDLTFFVSVSEEISLHRKDDIPSSEFLRLRREGYEKLAGEIDAVQLDGELPISELRQTLKFHTYQLFEETI